MEEFLSEFLSVYTCGAYGSNDPATAQFNKPKSTVDAAPPAVEAPAASSATTTTLAKHDGSGAMEEFISEFVSFYSCNVGLPTLPPPQPSAESNEEAPTTATAATNEQLAGKEVGDDEEGAVEEFLREFIAFYSMGTIGTDSPTSTTNTSNTTTDNEPSIEKAKAYYPASSPTESNPGKSTSEEEGMMKEFLREFVAFYTLQGDDVETPVGEAGESPQFAPAVSPEEENTGAADNNNSPVVAEESRNDTPTVDNDDDTEDEKEEEEDDTNVIEAVANNTDNGLPFPLNTMENKPASLPTASSSSSSPTTKQGKKKSSRSFVPKKMKKLFSSKKKSGASSSAQAVQ